MLKKYSLNQLLVLVMTGGFVFLTADTILEHWKVFTDEWTTFIPVVFALIGAVAGLAALLTWSERWIHTLNIVLAISIVVGILGVYLHLQEDDELTEAKGQALTQAQIKELEEKEGDRPILAPLSYAAMAVIGLLGTARKWPADVKES